MRVRRPLSRRHARDQEAELNRGSPNVGRFTPASDILLGLLNDLPAERVTLCWLLGRLPGHSFGLVMLLLGVLAIAPGICVLPGLLLVVAAFQMLAGHSAPSFPRWIAARSLPTRALGAVTHRAVPVLRHLEKVVFPRWPGVLAATRPFVGIAVMLLSARLLLTPIPLSNVVPALVIVLIALAWLEEDGLVLTIGLLTGCVVLAVDLWLVWEMIRDVKWISHFW
jgi:hypothetical protein